MQDFLSFSILMITSMGCQLASEDIGFCGSKESLSDQAFCKAYVQNQICMPISSVKIYLNQDNMG